MTGKDIKLYALIDFDGFRRLVDAVGGIQIDVPEQLYDPEYPTANWGYTVVNIPAGLQTFDGDKALKYARSRHTTSDFDRSHRQQLVIQALKEKMMSLNVLTSRGKIEEIYGVVRDSVKTNLAIKDMLGFAKLATKVDTGNIFSYTLNVSCVEALRLCQPGGLLYTPSRDLFNGMSVLLPRGATAYIVNVYGDIQKLVTVATEYPLVSKNPGLAVINASGRTSLANSVALKLRSIGIPVDEELIGNQTEKVEKTFIRYNPNIIMTDDVFFQAISITFYGEVREATPEELMNMKSPYELVLGTDSSLYF